VLGCGGGWDEAMAAAAAGGGKEENFPSRAKNGPIQVGCAVCLPTPTSAGWHQDFGPTLKFFLRVYSFKGSDLRRLEVQNSKKPVDIRICPF
jgi:hypothetical protein